MRLHWQQKPMFIKAGLPVDFLKLKPVELFKLAANAEVESRLINRKMAGKHWRYRAEDGPFEAARISKLKHKGHWTLLVQRVNEWLPRVDLLLEYFQFIANWRVDDIMVSYASPGGTVGAHMDNYDVFLCQLQGQRTWQFSTHPSHIEQLEANQPVRLLTDFVANKTIVTEPGDILYIPPRFAHYGVADTECITVSVGFRAPRIERLMGIFFDEMVSKVGDTFYTDKGTRVQQKSGMFSESAIKNLTRQAKAGFQLLSRLEEDESLTDAMLQNLSITPNAQIQSRSGVSVGTFKERWKRQALQRNPRNQYFYREHAGSVTLYAAGESFTLPARQRYLIEDLCNHRVFLCEAKRLRPLALEFWYEMFRVGFVFFPK